MSFWRNLWQDSIGPLFPESRDTPGQAYRYRSLGLASGARQAVGPPEEGDIRLLEVFPHPTGGGRIRCQLHHYLMLFPIQRREYYALSYEWGTGEEDSLIIIDGKGYLVTRHLQTALWRLRRTDRSIFLWIDAICIYQKMVVEKETQISMMHDIYGIADGVVVSLGEEADNSDLVPSFAELLITRLLLLKDNQASLQIQDGDLAKHGLPPAADQRWKALRDLFNRAWFSRKWVIQECVLAKALTVQCGESTFDFDLLSNCHTLCLQHGLDNIMAPSSHERLVITREHPFHIYLIIRERVRYNFDVDANGPEVTFPWLLVKTHYAQVTKAHDAYTLFWEYLAEVFTEYTSSLDWTNDYISLLEVAGLPKEVSGLPSWIPDWSYCSLRQPLASEHGEGQFCASQKTDRSGFMIDQHQKTLTVRGGLFDVVTKTSTAIWDHDEERAEIPSIMSRLIRQLNELTYEVHHYPPHKDMSSILCRTMIGGEQNDHVYAGVDYTQLFRECKAHLDANDGSTDTPAKFQSLVAAARNVCHTRKFCLTAKGYIGQVPSEAGLGDSICIILGEKVPFTLRSVGTRWKLVGDAYIHGIMRGTGLDYLGGGIRDIVLV